MAWEQRQVRRQKVRYNDDNDDNAITSQLLINGVKQTPSEATISIYKPGSSTAVVDEDSMTVTGTVLSYSVDTTTTTDFPIGTGYRCEMVITDADSLEHKRIMLIDVVRFVLDLRIGFDELVSLDDGIRGMGHDGDDDFGNIIVACRDLLQAKLETKAIQDKKLVESMILDHDTVANIARLYILGRIWFPKDRDRADQYFAEFGELWEAMLGGIYYDVGQDGEESNTLGELEDVRFVS